MTDDKDQQSNQPLDDSEKESSQTDSTDLAKIGREAENPSAQAETSSASPVAEKAPAQSSKFGGIPWVASLAIILVIIVATMSMQNSQQSGQLQLAQEKTARLNQQLMQEQQSFEQQLNSIQSSLAQNSSKVNTQFEKLQTDLTTAQRDRFDLEEKIKQVSLQASANGRDPLKWRLAEIEYLLSLANHRLVLSQDHITALTALNDADKRLRTIADPGLSQIRMSIANEIKSLQAVEVPDIAGMAMKLSALVDGIGQLPLVNRERMLVKEETGERQEVASWEQIPSAIWRDLKGLVTVRRSDLSIEPILPPDELHYLSQNLGLKIEQARLALLRKDEALFRSNLKDTGLWISRYFDHDTVAVSNVIDTINGLMSTEVVAVMPDISTSLRQLRRWRDSHGTAAFNSRLISKPKPKKLTSAPAAIIPKKISKIEVVKVQKKAAEQATDAPIPVAKELIAKVPTKNAPATKSAAAKDPVAKIPSAIIPSAIIKAPLNKPSSQTAAIEIKPADIKPAVVGSKMIPINPQSVQGLSSTSAATKTAEIELLTTQKSEADKPPADISTATQTTLEVVAKPSEVAP